MTDGAFRRDGGFVTQSAHDAAMLVEAWRRAVLSLFVRENWLEQDAAASMLAWPHSGFSAYVGPAIAAEDRAAVLRVACYGARAPVAESRLRYDAEHAEVELSSDAVDGPYAGVHRMAAVEFVARLVQHIPGKGEVRVRYYGAYASRRRGWWRRRGVVLVGAGRHEVRGDRAERASLLTAGGRGVCGAAGGLSCDGVRGAGRGFRVIARGVGGCCAGVGGDAAGARGGESRCRPAGRGLRSRGRERKFLSFRRPACDHVVVG